MTAPSDDPFGLRSLSSERLRTKRGAKWQGIPGPLAAWVADMDFPTAPVIRDRLSEVLARSELGYPVWARSPNWSPASQAFVARMSERFSWEPSPARIFELNDVIQGVRAVIHHVSRPGDGVVLHTPAYHPFLDTIVDMDRRLVAVPAPYDYDELDRRLAADPARVWILCHPQNPTGHVFERIELERIAEIAARHDLVVISDEIHADLVHAPHEHVPFERLGRDVSARTVTVTSASKAFNLAGLRWAVMHMGSDEMVAAIASLPDHYLGAANIMAVEATHAAWTEGASWLAAVMAVLDENRHVLTEVLRARLPAIRYTPPEATYLAWLDCRELGFGDDPARTFMQRGVRLSSGPEFGDDGRGFVRLNLATSPSVLAEIVAAMATPVDVTA